MTVLRVAEGGEVCREEIEAARARIGSRIRLTPCRISEHLSGLVGGEVFLKLESLQETGSFKLRGVMNAILWLGPAAAGRILVAASTGNHGAAFAHAVSKLGLEGRLYMPRSASTAKVERVRATGLPLELVGEDCVEAELAAAAWAREHGAVWISPYNDPRVVAGQATVAAELLDQLSGFDEVLVPVGGGGLIGGMAACLKAVRHEVRVIGCQPRASCVMARSVAAGRLLELPSLPTLSDATAGGVEQGSITFELCRDLVDEWILVDEDEIAAAIRLVHEQEDLIVEGAAALPVAALLGGRERFRGRRVVLVLSGGGIDRAALLRLGTVADGGESGEAT
jgi:threonine dehydratase